MTDNDPQQRAEIPFGPKESMLLHQLRLLEWMATTGRKRFVDDDVVSDTEQKPHAAIPDKWELTKGITAYPWQETCIANWFKNKGRGTVKVVTGGGKTLLAMSIAQRLQNHEDKDLRLVIVVPTIVLMHQWYERYSGAWQPSDRDGWSSRWRLS